MRLFLHELAHTTQPARGGDTVLRFPSVSGWEFHNKDGGTTAADNCCAVCPRNTGVDSWPGSFKNGMELQAYLNNEPGASYDLKRVKERSTWERVGGKWNLTSNIGPGADDDSTDTDECLTPQIKPPYLPYIFSEDQPGFSSRAGFDGAATDAVYKASFTESVSITAGGKTAVDPKTFDWHTITWLVKGAAGWSIDKTRTEIASGSVTVGKTGP
jgi:hypothetical protein